MGKVFGGIAALAGIAVVIWMLAGGEERKIRSRLDELADAASVSVNESPLARAARLGRIGQFLVQDVRVNLGAPYPPIWGRDTLLGLAASVPAARDGMLVELLDVTVAIAPDSAEATVHATAKVTRGAPAGTAEQVDAREIELTMRKDAEEWKIAAVRPIETIQRPGSNGLR